MSRLEESKQIFLNAGGKLSWKATTTRLDEADARARAEATRRSSAPNPWAAAVIKNALGYLAVFFFIAVLTVGVGLLLIMIPAAEYIAVHQGLSTVTDNEVVVGVTAVAIFIGTIVLMFLRHVYEDSLTNGKPSLFGSKNQPKLEQDYTLIRVALWIAKAAIMGSSFLGRIGTTFTAYQDKPVGQAIESIQQELTAQELVGALVTVIILFAILTILDVGVLFIYTAFKNSAGKLDIAEVTLEDFLPLYESLSDQYKAEALTDMALQMESVRQREIESQSNS